MLNELHVEGVVTGRRWRYSEAEFVRIAVHPDPGRAARRDAEGREAPDFITLRCEGQHALAAHSLREGDRIRAAGMLTSRDYDIPLETFAAKARGAADSLAALRALAREHGAALAMPHTLNELLVERLAVVERRPPSEARVLKLHERVATPSDPEPAGAQPAGL
jgi:hypothetical protein